MTTRASWLRRTLGTPWLRAAVLLLVVGAGAAALVTRGDLGAVTDHIAGADPVLLVLALGVYAVSWPFRGARYRSILGGMGHGIGLWGATGAVFVSQTANLVAPLRSGDLSRAYVARERWGVPYRPGTASLVVERALDLGTVAALGAAGAVPVAGAIAGATGRARAALLAAGLATAATASGLMALHRGWGRRLVGWTAGGRLAPLGRFVEEVLDGFAATGRTRGVWLQSLAIWGIDVAAAMAVAVAVGVPMTAALPPAMLLAVSAGNLAKVVPATPGGVGLYEAAFAAVATAVLPVSLAVAVAAAVVDHAVKNGVTVVGGLSAAASLQISVLQNGPD